MHLATPLVTLRALREIAAVPDIAGIKEYYGLLPDREDPNLRMTALFLKDPLIEEDEALAVLSAPYGPAAESVAEFWRLCCDAMELFPWDASWLLRGVGRSDPSHGMSAATVRGHVAHTPSWESTRRAIFMKTENEESDPWLLEDLQLRFGLAADRMAKAAERRARGVLERARLASPHVRGVLGGVARDAPQGAGLRVPLARDEPRHVHAPDPRGPDARYPANSSPNCWTSWARTAPTRARRSR